MTAKRAVSGVIAILLTVAASGCVGGSRSGTDQPGLPGPANTTSGPVSPAQKESINETSEDDLAAALRRSDVDDPQGWRGF
jgi:hypothetical protein